MASPRGINGNPGDSDFTFQPADADGELNLQKTKDFPVDPVSSKVTTTNNELMEHAKAEQKMEEEKEKEKKDATQKLKSTIIISGVVVAVIGAIFAITKKLREK
uniref:Uncharacterized protein n=1 Tax=Nelumbo nucifera TaxID=4432 RepID=A0A822YCQ7_NELNU|nr:TPA_asm: hypothetical protein HUJ06_030314 [Nelumbo nucifera]